MKHWNVGVTVLAVMGAAVSACNNNPPTGCFRGANDAVFTGDGADLAGVSRVPLSACSPSAYAASVNVGMRPLQLLVDTGSATLAVAGQTCDDCLDAGVEHFYQPTQGYEDLHQTAESSYGALASSGWSGEIYDDGISLGIPSIDTAARFVAIQHQSDFFVGSCGAAGTVPEGVLGLQPQGNAINGTDSVIDDLTGSGGITNVFAVGLCPTGGMLWLGGYDPAVTSAPPVYTPISPPEAAGYVYTVDLQEIDVGGASVPVHSGAYTSALLDTGSDITSLTPAAFAAVTQAIAASPGFNQAFGVGASAFFADPHNCAATAHSKGELDSMLPALALKFANPSGPVLVNASATESYLKPAGCNVWCPALTQRAPSPDFETVDAILGAPLLRSNIVIFDRQLNRVGFAPHVPCPSDL